jgi:CRP/FNR family transcriptional regulator, cyclic AMP receptor protein
VSSAFVDRLRTIPLFAELGDDSLARVAGVLSEFEVPEGHVLIQPGHEGAGMFVLEEGSVTVEIPGGGSVELGAGEFFGELSILGPGIVRTARVRAATPVRCLALARADFAAILESEPRIAAAMLPVLARRLAGLESRA